MQDVLDVRTEIEILKRRVAALERLVALLVPRRPDTP
jgi:hypothetical protein